MQRLERAVGNDFGKQHEEFAAWLVADQAKGSRKRVGDEVLGRCPLPEHEDKHPSFRYNAVRGIWVCSCGKGVGTELWKRLSWQPLNGRSNGNGQHQAKREPDAIHQYANGNRKLRFRKADGSKVCKWEHWDGEAWVSGIGGDPGLYRQGDISSADLICLSESETDADALKLEGFPAVSTAMGANVPLKSEQAALFAGKRVFIFEHQDEPGREFSVRCSEALLDVGARPLIVRPPAGCKDIRDHLLAGGTQASVQALINDAEKAYRKSLVEVVSAAELAAETFPEREWIFGDKRLASESLGLAYGESRSGKGTLLLLWSIAAAIGWSFGDGFAATRNWPVVFFTAEDTRRRIQERSRGVAKGFVMPMEEIPDLHFIVKPKVPIKLNDRATADRLLSAIEPIAPKLIVLDGLRRLFDGDENDGEVVTPVMENIEYLRDKTGACVLLIHHTPKTQSTKTVYASRGSTVIPAIVDFQLRFERPDGGNVCNVLCHDSRDFEDWRAAFQQIRGEDGTLQYKLLSDAERSQTEYRPSTKDSTRARILEAVGRIHAEHHRSTTYPELAGVLDQSEKCIRGHVDAMAATGGLRVIPGGGRGKKAEIYPPSGIGGVI